MLSDDRYLSTLLPSIQELRQYSRNSLPPPYSELLRNCVQYLRGGGWFVLRFHGETKGYCKIVSIYTYFSFVHCGLYFLSTVPTVRLPRDGNNHGIGNPVLKKFQIN